MLSVHAVLGAADAGERRRAAVSNIGPLTLLKLTWPEGPHGIAHRVAEVWVEAI
jgi:hypothetical protein